VPDTAWVRTQSLAVDVVAGGTTGEEDRGEAGADGDGDGDDNGGGDAGGEGAGVAGGEEAGRGEDGAEGCAEAEAKKAVVWAGAELWVAGGVGLTTAWHIVTGAFPSA
jgi:hypothetical protein